MSWGLLVVCIWATIIAGEAQSDGGESRLVNIAQGPVRGYRDPEWDLYAFYNIPYATVKDRYKPSVAPPTWSQPFEAVDRDIKCPQRTMEGVYPDDDMMVEDCLITNIFVPDTEQINLPVVVIVHGGAFRSGVGNNQQYKHYTVNQNMITITFNYRVSVLGFLCLGTENVPGNAGMKDQVALLRWVKQNIANFGGNPDDVTISGCSAGGVAVSLLALSHTTKGLFNKVISNSGASLGALAVQADPLENAKMCARALNFTDVDNIDALEKFYMTSSPELLTTIPFTSNKDAAVIFGPCVERDTGGEMFLTDAPYNLLKRGDYTRYPIMFGIAEMEGINRLVRFSLWKDEMNEKFSDFLPADLQFESEEQKEEVARVIKEFYFGTQPVSEHTILPYVEYFSDSVFAYSALFATELYFSAGNSTIYLYEYSFVDNNTSIIPGTNVRGANHCDQSVAVYDEDETNFTEEYRQMKNIMRDLWASFIRTGQPILDGSPLATWPPVGANRSPHLSVGQTLEVRGPLLEQRTRFWDDIYERHYRVPVPPQNTNSACLHNKVYLLYFFIAIFSYIWNKV